MSENQNPVKVDIRRIEMDAGPSDSRTKNRTGSIAKFGMETYNQPFYSDVCANCGKRTPMEGGTVMVMDPDFSFDDFNGMISCAVKCHFLFGVLKRAKISPCCKSACRIASDYFVYHTGFGKDLVVRTIDGAEPNSVEFALHIADDDGYRPAPVLTHEEMLTVKRDSLLRFAAQFLDNGKDPAPGLSFIKKAFQQFPGDPMQLRFVHRLLNRKQIGLAEGIAREHLARFPEDAQAHYLMSEVLLQGYAANWQEKQLLSEAEYHARCALSLNSNLQEAQLSICNVLRLRQDAGTIQAFEKLVSDWPGYASGHYNYALHHLPTRPEVAFKHFCIGEQLEPRDADYPLGCARASMKLGRKQEAWDAIARAKKLNPDHPRIRELEQQLGARSS